jgi:subtilisin family serine protease
MPEPQRLPHIKVDSFYQNRTYNYPKDVIVKFPLAPRNRAMHGNALLQQLDNIRQEFQIDSQEELPANIVRDEALYVEFYSEVGFPLKFDSLNQDAKRPQFKLLTVKEEIIRENGEDKKRYRVVVMMREGGVSTFIKKVTAYLLEFTKDKKGNTTDKPKNADLIANIARIQLATLESLWTDAPEIPFPALDAIVWWEAWFRKTNDDGTKLARVRTNLEAIGAQLSPQMLEFPEHRVMLVKASARQLSSSLMLLDNLAELRKPQEINDFIAGRNIAFPQQQEWLRDLQSRTDAQIDGNSTVICLLDSGVNNRHPLLENFLPDERLHAYRPDWGTNDTWPQGGHGTGMAGMALYGDITQALASMDRVKIYHGLESFKIIHPSTATDPEFYGVLTEYACSAPYASHPDNKRIFCLAVTDGDIAFYGRPSSWSSAIDKIAFGNMYDPVLPQLLIVSGGNVNYLDPGVSALDYPVKNQTESIHNPSQAYNALVAGAYTRMDRIDQAVWRGVAPLASHGGMAPANSTSLMWERQWPVKPDIVFEGGNLGVEQGKIRDDIHTLKPLSLDKEFLRNPFIPFGDTSGAAALAAKMAAELTSRYPEYWPESIRGLIVHSADWTNTMLNGLNFSRATNADKQALLRSFGYGVPILDSALYSAGNSLTLIAESHIQPYRLEKGTVRYNEYHLYNLPWPREILLNELTTANVRLKVTLSYFIDPNPGNRQYANSFHYHSHALDFKVIKPTEDLATFQRRISAAAEGEEDHDYEGGEEPWSLSERARNKGSIKKDFILTSGAELATRHTLAIFPKAGWYKTRKKLEKYSTSVRYSLIVSIETDAQNIDLYTPVFNQLPVPIPVQVG